MLDASFYTSNPNWSRLAPLWQTVEDCYLGVENIKSRARGMVYLRPQPAEYQELQSSKPFTETRYAFRQAVATYTNIFKPTIDDIVGLMGKNPFKVRFGIENDEESPKEVRDINVYGNRYGDGLIGVKTRMNHEQALFGRYGLLLDILTDGNGLKPAFCITEYQAFDILDGDFIDSSYDTRKRLRWALLNESTQRHNGGKKTWETWIKLRVVGIDRDNRYYNAVIEGDGAFASWGSFNLDAPTENGNTRVVYPTYQGKQLDFVPLTICNIDRLGLDNWQAPPYLDVAQIALGNYVVDSWYKMALYQHSTPTLAVFNAQATKDVRLGGVLNLTSPKTGGASASATILETSGSGIGTLRDAKQELKNDLKYSSIRDLLDGAGANSSGDALRLRTTSGTAAISIMDNTSARAIEEQLCWAAEWAGATKEEAGSRISFKADTTYLGQEFSIQSVVAFLQANNQNKVLSKQNQYAILEKTFPGVVTSYDDNEAQLLAEEDVLFGQIQQATLMNNLAQAANQSTNRNQGENDDE